MTGNWIDKAATQRVMEGVRRHGPLDLSTDPRCFIRESLEEMLDVLNYTKWGYEKGQISEKDWQHVDQITRYVIGIIEKSCPWMKGMEGEI